MGDLLVVVMLVAGAHFGHLRGLVRAGGDLLSLLLGLFLTALLYPFGGWVLRGMGMAPNLANVGGFVLTAVAVVFGSSMLVAHVAERLDLHPHFEKLGGAAAGVVNAGVLLAAFLPLAAVTGSSGTAVANATLARPFMAGIPWGMEAADRIGFPLPKMILLPTKFEMEGTPGMRHGLQLLRINFTRLEGATCIACRGKMHFEGYLRRFPPAISPKLKCTQCGRTTDGCQCFEGMHTLYDECPVAVARRGVYLDCGVWTNNNPVQPKGKCPVCGQELTGVVAPPAPPPERLRADDLLDW